MSRVCESRWAIQSRSDGRLAPVNHDVDSAGTGSSAARVATVESVLAHLDSAEVDLSCGELDQRLRDAVSTLRPSEPFPGDLRELELLGDLYERLGLNSLVSDPEAAAIDLYRAAVVGLLRGDADLRLRCLEISADVHRAAGNIEEAATDYRAVAAAYAESDPARAEALLMEAASLGEVMLDDAPLETALPDAPLPSTEFFSEPDLNSVVEEPEPIEDDSTDTSGDATAEQEQVYSPDPESILAVLDVGMDTSGSTTVAHQAASELYAELLADVAAMADPANKAAAGTAISETFDQHWTAVFDTALENIAAGSVHEADWRFRYLIEAHGFPDGPGDDLIGRCWLGRVQLCLPSSPTLRNVVVEAANYITSISSPVLRANLASELAGLLNRVPGPERIRKQLLDGAEADFRSVGNEVEVLRCRLAKAMDLAFAGNYREAHDRFTDISARARQVRDLPLYSDALLNLGRSWAFAGRPDGAVDCFDRVLKHFPAQNLHDAREAEAYGKLALERGRVMAKSDLPQPEPGETSQKYFQIAYDTFSRFDLTDLAETARSRLQR